MSRGFFVIDRRYVVETQDNGDSLLGILVIALNNFESTFYSSESMSYAIMDAIEDLGEPDIELQRWSKEFDPFPYNIIEINTFRSVVLHDGVISLFEEVRGFG